MIAGFVFILHVSRPDFHVEHKNDIDDRENKYLTKWFKGGSKPGES
jgi:hypothetical protein